MSEGFHLKWNDFQSFASKSFHIFRNEAYLHDVTLVSDDFQQIPAHKLVLSSCSEYFRNIFQNTKQAQPLLCLDGVNSDILRNVLDYVYNGEVKVQQDNLDQFLYVSQKFKLEGLLRDDDNEDKTDLENKHEGLLGGDDDDDDEDNTDLENGYEENEIQEEPETKNETSKEVPQQTKRTYHPRKADKVFNFESLSPEELKITIEQNIIQNYDKSLNCKICGRYEPHSRHGKWSMRRHMEVHIRGLNYPCSECDKTFKSKNAFSNHFYKVHRL